MSYDVKCGELAEYFLEDLMGANMPSIVLIERLAERIQDTIEDFLSDLESDRQQELEAAKDEAIERKLDLKREGSL